jgi:hypothetical protein
MLATTPRGTRVPMLATYMRKQVFLCQICTLNNAATILCETYDDTGVPLRTQVFLCRHRCSCVNQHRQRTSTPRKLIHTYTHVHTRTHAQTPAHTHARTHARTHAHTHTGKGHELHEHRSHITKLNQTNYTTGKGHELHEHRSPIQRLSHVLLMLFEDAVIHTHTHTTHAQNTQKYIYIHTHIHTYRGMGGQI